MKGLVALDFDGVVVDSVAAKGHAFVTALGIKSTDTEIVREIMGHHIGNPAMGRREKFIHYMSRFAGVLEKDLDLSELCDLFALNVVSELSKRGPMPGLVEFLENKKSRYEFQICSSAPAHEIEEILEELNLAQYFSHTCGYPTNKTVFLEQKKKEFPNVIFIGDSPTDEEAAELAKVDFIGFRLHKENRAGPNAQNFSELESILEKMGDGE